MGSSKKSKKPSSSVTEVVPIGNTEDRDYEHSEKPSRSWEITINNYSDLDIAFLKNLDVNRITVSKEISSTGTPHLQGKIVFKRAYRFKQLKKLHKQAHWEASITTENDHNYCKKFDSDIIINENYTKQGKRVDLEKIKKRLLDGEKLEDLFVNGDISVWAFNTYRKTWEYCESLYMNSHYRTSMPKITWYVGKTGVGKSHAAFHGKPHKDIYLVPNDNNWWDNYKQQKHMVFNDYRGRIPYNEFIQILDSWNYQVSRRNNCPLNVTSENIVITSSLLPQQIYHNRMDEDSIDQLLRRITIIEIDENREHNVLSTPDTFQDYMKSLDPFNII
jgi:hypothetical protein